MLIMLVISLLRHFYGNDNRIAYPNFATLAIPAWNIMDHDYCPQRGIYWQSLLQGINPFADALVT